MNIGNITSDNFNLDGNGKDMQIEVYKQLIEQLQKENKELKTNWKKLKEYLNYQSERAVGEDEYVYDEIYNEMQELESSDNQ